MKQHLELPSGERVFYGIVSWDSEEGENFVRERFGGYVIAKTEEQAKRNLREACLGERPNYKNGEQRRVELLSPILFYY